MTEENNMKNKLEKISNDLNDIFHKNVEDTPLARDLLRMVRIFSFYEEDENGTFKIQNVKKKHKKKFTESKDYELEKENMMVDFLNFILIFLNNNIEDTSKIETEKEKKIKELKCFLKELNFEEYFESFLDNELYDLKIIMEEKLSIFKKHKTKVLKIMKRWE
jgi:hypothetical protein